MLKLKGRLDEIPASELVPVPSVDYVAMRYEASFLPEEEAIKANARIDELIARRREYLRAKTQEEVDADERARKECLLFHGEVSDIKVDIYIKKKKYEKQKEKIRKLMKINKRIKRRNKDFLIRCCFLVGDSYWM